jgi:hypothetical protein
MRQKDQHFVSANGASTIEVLYWAPPSSRSALALFQDRVLHSMERGSMFRPSKLLRHARATRDGKVSPD